MATSARTKHSTTRPKGRTDSPGPANRKPGGRRGRRVHTAAPDRVDFRHGDSLEVLQRVASGSVDSVVTDPPYGLAALGGALVADVVAKWLAGDRAAMPDGDGFANLGWDAFVPPPALWSQVLRILKPGGHLIAFAGARTQDLMGLSLRLAGFEIRDSLMWVYHTGFPKSANVSKNIDRRHGERVTPVGSRVLHDIRGGDWAGQNDKGTRRVPVFGDEAVTDQAVKWVGWGTALKPAYEPILIARAPVDGTVTDNLLTHGVGALNIDGCRTAGEDTALGRWPANAAFGHAESCGDHGGPCLPGCPVASLGDAARFYPVIKPGKAERVTYRNGQGQLVGHPTVKPVALMQHLVRLVTPPGGVLCEPFAGSGSTVEAALMEDVGRILAVEMTAAYLPLTQMRVERAVAAAR